MKTSHCTFCNALVVWAETSSGKRIPVDPDPGFAGNVILSQGAKGEVYARVLTKRDDRPQGPVFHRSHFSTCPKASKARRSA